MTYQWEYLNNEERGEKIYSFLKPYIEKYKCETFFDFMCGYAPLWPYLKGYNYHVGFDNSWTTSQFLAHEIGLLSMDVSEDKSYDENFHFPIDVFLHLGMLAGNLTHRGASKTEHLSSVRLIDKYNPKVIVLEKTINLKTDYWDYIRANIDYRYKCDLSEKYTIPSLKLKPEREIEIYVKK